MHVQISLYFIIITQHERISEESLKKNEQPPDLPLYIEQSE